MIGRLILAIVMVGPLALVCAFIVIDELKHDRSGYQYWTQRAREIEERKR